MKTGNLVSRLQAKYNALQKAVGESIYDVPPVTVDRYALFLSYIHTHDHLSRVPVSVSCRLNPES